MKTRGWPYAFNQRPWDEIAQFLSCMAETSEEFECVANIAQSVIATGSSHLLAGMTSMHDILVVSTPVPESPVDVVAIRAPDSLKPPKKGNVLIEHLAVSGHNDRVERPVGEAVPLFWRFMVEKFGVHPASPPG